MLLLPETLALPLQARVITPRQSLGTAVAIVAELCAALTLVSVGK